MATSYCPLHLRIWQPASLSAPGGGYAAHWRPFAPEVLAWAQHLARQAGCAGQIAVEVRSCDRCEGEGMIPAR